MSNGDQLLIARIANDLAMVARGKAVAANFLPEFNFTVEANYKGDASGTLGGKTEYIGKIELTWPLELFGTQFNSYRAAMLSGLSAEVSYARSIQSVEDAITNGWISYQLASVNRANVQNQVAIAEQFLRLAQMEVQQGRGQMMLVMNAQNALINAQKALQNNTSDYAVQVYSLLAQMGELTFDNLKQAAVDEVEIIKKNFEEYKKKVELALKKAAKENEPESVESGD